MRIDDITPFVRYIHYIEPRYMYDSRTKLGYDHRIFFCESGYIHITVEGETYTLEKILCSTCRRAAPTYSARARTRES